MKKLLVVVLACFSILASAQSNKSVEVGCAIAASSARIPFSSRNINASFIYNKSQIQVGFDIYSRFRNIYGMQAAYKYLFSDKRIVNFFVDFNIHYVQFGEGCSLPVSYNFIPKNVYDNCIFLYKTKSLVNTLGFGLKATFLKRISLNFILGGGYNYNIVKKSPYEDPIMPTPQSKLGNHFIPAIYANLGLSFKLWKDK